MKLTATHCCCCCLLTAIVIVVLLKPTAVRVVRVVPLQHTPPQQPIRTIARPIEYRRRIYSGVPQHYTPVGYLRREEDGHLYPLYGRASRTNAQRWNYHTTANGIDAHGSIRLPVIFDKSDCTRDLGCRELYNDDAVTVPGVNGTFRAQLYSSDFNRRFE